MRNIKCSLLAVTPFRPPAPAGIGGHLIANTFFCRFKIHVLQTFLIARPRFVVIQRYNDFKRLPVARFCNFQHEGKRKFQTAFPILRDVRSRNAPMPGKRIVRIKRFVHFEQIQPLGSGTHDKTKPYD